jgi:hypothetical protein
MVCAEKGLFCEKIIIYLPDFGKKHTLLLRQALEKSLLQEQRTQF